MEEAARRPAERSEGARLFTLLTRPGDWIHRRVDRTDLEADGETTRHMSFDLTMDPSLMIERQGGLVAPLTLLTKTPLRRLDTFGADGQSLPVLGRDDNGELVTSMLIAALTETVPGNLSLAVRDAVRAAVFEDDTMDMPTRIDALAAAMDAEDSHNDAQVEAVLSLAADLTQQFMFAVLLPTESAGKRSVVKVSVTEDVSPGFPDWAFSKEGRSMYLPLTLTDAAASANFEFRAPLGLRVASVALLDEHGEQVTPAGPSINTGRTAHLTGLQSQTPTVGATVQARVELEPVADGLVLQTAGATLFVTMLMFVAAWQDDRLQTALTGNRGGSVVAVALAVPALFLSIQARRPEHAWVARALFVPRLLNIVTAVVLYAAAIYLITVNPDDSALPSVMWVFFAAQLVPTGLAVALHRVVSAEQPML